MKRFQQARSPTGHQAEPGQLESPVGAWEHGAANQVKPPPAESAAALGGQAEIERGGEPNWQAVAAQAAPRPAPPVPVGKPASCTDPSAPAAAREKVCPVRFGKPSIVITSSPVWVTAPPVETVVVVVGTATGCDPVWSSGEATATPVHSLSWAFPLTVAGFMVKVTLLIPP